MNFDNYLFHCSSLGKLAHNAKSGNGLAKETEEYLQDIFIEQVYGRKRIIDTKEMQKGNYAEEQSLSIATKFFGSLLYKNKKELKNEYICGTPDVTKPWLIDIKTSWDIFTFPMFEKEWFNKDYYYQVDVGYAWLLELSEGTTTKLAYVLSDLPDWMSVKQKKFSQLYDLDPNSEAYLKLEAEYDKLHFYGDLPIEKRVKVFDMQVKLSDREEMKLRIQAARNYLNSLL